MKDKNMNRKDYRKTKVGWIPRSWTIKKLNEFTTIKSGGTPSKTNTSYWDGTIPWISSSDLLEDSIYSININKYITQQAIAKSATKLIPSNSILIVSRVGVGKVAINYCSICTSQDFQNLIFDSSKVNPMFLAVSVKLKTTHLSLKKQGTSISGFLKKDLESTSIPLPPLPEQKAIASVLECWDKAIRKYEEKIEKKKNIKKGLMQKLLSGEQRLPEFDGEWEEVELGNLGSFSKGKGISRNDTVSSGLPCIRYGEIYTTEAFVLNKFESFISQDTALQSKQITKNELLFACSGETLEDIGKSIAYMGTTTVYAGGDIVVFSPHDNNVRCDFLAYYFNTQARPELRRRGQGQSVVHIYSKHLKEIVLQLPGGDEQKAIASVLSSADSEIKVLEEKLALLRDQKKYLLNNLVTGTIRLPEFCKEVG